MKMTLAEIAKLVNGTVHGDPGVQITGVNGITEAQPGDLAMVRDRKYAARLGESRAAALLVAEVTEDITLPAVLVPNPDLAFALVLQHIEREQRCHPVGIHETAVVSETARLGEGVALGAHVFVDAGCEIAAGVILYPGVVVGQRVRIGAGTVIYPNVTLREDTRVGARCIIHANTAIGSDGFGFVPWNGQWAKIPQVGFVVIEDDVEIGSNTAIDRAKCGVTRVGRGTKIASSRAWSESPGAPSSATTCDWPPVRVSRAI
jgi:UDP-3-O-[3-hydroxymyristoyl] glucosamine N-acyltransferase